MAVLIILSVGAVPCAAEGIKDMQLFAPFVPTTYGTQPHPNEGLFFSFDYMIWNVSTPEPTSIGAPGHERRVWTGPETDGSSQYTETFNQGNSHTTGIFTANFTNGQRYEIGRIIDRRGWIFRAFHLNSQSQNRPTATMEIAFVDHDWGDAGLEHLEGDVDPGSEELIKPLPVTFASGKIHNRVRTWGVELDYLIRSRQMHTGGFFELTLGARYLEFNEDFYVQAFGRRILVEEEEEEEEEETYNIEGVLADSFWTTDANNHIVGPQIGLRYFHKYKYWTFSTEGMFFAGYNSQNIYQTGVLGSELGESWHTGLAPIAMGTTAFSHSRTLHEWSPGVEFRLQADWHVTRYTTLGVGWTGIWLGGIARPSNMINYELGSDTSQSSFMGILSEHNRQDVFINGVNFRIAFNR